MPLNKSIQANFKQRKIVDRQKTSDIVRLLLECERDSRIHCEELKKYFYTGNDLQTANKIWNFMKQNITYVKESDKKQTGKTVGRILADKYGDCKAFATFSIVALKSCGIKSNFRLASYKYYDKTPTHIYTVANIDGKKIVVDGVLDKFNQEANYKYAYDVKPI